MDFPMFSLLGSMGMVYEIHLSKLTHPVENWDGL